MATLSTRAYPGGAIALQPELLPGETLLWSGQPQLGVIFHASDWIAIPFSLFWGGFAILWELSAIGYWGNPRATGPALDAFALWGIPFVLVGQYLIWGRFLYTAWRKSRTHYGVTNKRVLVLSTGLSRKITDAYFRNLTSVSLALRPNGIGTIEFAPEQVPQFGLNLRSSRRQGFQMYLDLSRLAFFDIAEARGVYQIVQAQRDESNKAQ
ncbi:MAG: PH domain-containing protein [Terracidiphilus sp.]